MKASSTAILKFYSVIDELKPDLVVVLGVDMKLFFLCC